MYNIINFLHAKNTKLSPTEAVLLSELDKSSNRLDEKFKLNLSGKTLAM